MRWLKVIALLVFALPAVAQMQIVYTRSGLGAIADPTFSPVSPYTGGATSVAISDTTAGATINYCTDGTNTCTPSTVYTGTINVSATEFIRAQATILGVPSSNVVSWSGTITGGSSPTYVNYCVNSAAASTTSCATNINITAGNALVVHSKTSSTAPGTATATFSIASGTGTCGTFTYAINATALTDNYQTAVGVCKVSGTGSATVQVAWANGTATFTDIAVAEYSPVTAWSSTILDQSANSAGNSTGNPCSTGSITTTNANDLVIAFCDTFNQAETWGSLSGYTLRSNSTRNTVAWYDQYVTSTGTFAPSITLGNADNSTGVIISLKD